MSAAETQSPARGQTYYGDGAIDTNNYGTSVELEGRPATFPNTSPVLQGGRTVRRNGGSVHALLVRNTSGVTLTPGREVCFATGYEGRRVNRYARSEAERIAGVVDDHYGSAGVRNGDLFWLVIKGQCLIKTPASGAGLNYVVGDLLFAQTAHTTGETQGTIGGKPAPWTGFTSTSTGTTDGTALRRAANYFAVCLSAKTTNQTEQDMLVDVVNLF